SQVLPGFERVAVEATDVPFMVQISGVPLEFWNAMSDWPSPLKSPVAMACQLLPGFDNVVVDVTVEPFMVQIIGVPVAVCQRMSALPSELKSPEPTMCHPLPGLGSVAWAVTVVPFIRYWSGASAAVLSVKTMSDLPSPSKSFFTRVLETEMVSVLEAV